MAEATVVERPAPTSPEDATGATQKAKLSEKARENVKKFTAGIRKIWRRDNPRPALDVAANGAKPDATQRADVSSTSEGFDFKSQRAKVEAARNLPADKLKESAQDGNIHAKTAQREQKGSAAAETDTSAPKAEDDTSERQNLTDSAEDQAEDLKTFQTEHTELLKKYGKIPASPEGTEKQAEPKAQQPNTTNEKHQDDETARRKLLEPLSNEALEDRIAIGDAGSKLAETIRDERQKKEQTPGAAQNSQEADAGAQSQEPRPADAATPEASQTTTETAAQREKRRGTDEEFAQLLNKMHEDVSSMSIEEQEKIVRYMNERLMDESKIGKTSEAGTQSPSPEDLLSAVKQLTPEQIQQFLQTENGRALLKIMQAFPDKAGEILDDMTNALDGVDSASGQIFDKEKALNSSLGNIANKLAEQLSSGNDETTKEARRKLSILKILLLTVGIPLVVIGAALATEAAIITGTAQAAQR